MDSLQKNVRTFQPKRADVFIRTNVRLNENKRSFFESYQQASYQADGNQSIFVSSVSCPVTESMMKPRTIKSCGTSG